LFCFVLLGLVFVSAQISSTNYQTSLAATDGGGAFDSASYDMNAVAGVLSGVTSSDVYDMSFGVFYGENVAPSDVVPVLVSVDGLNLTTSDLNCSAIVYDWDSDSLDVNVRWYKDGVLNLSVDYGGYASGSLFSAILDSGNTSKGEVWICGVRTYDGEEYGAWVNSSGLTVLNSLPNVTLSGPSDWNSTKDRSPEFSWVGIDDDGDVLSYEINISDVLYTGTKNCEDKRSIDGIDVVDYVFSNDLLCLYGNGYYYEWSVRANDGEGWGAWSEIWHLNITTEVGIVLINDGVNFGAIVPGDIDNSSDDSPSPFEINNDGNVIVNVSVNSSQLWSTQSEASEYYQFKADSVVGQEGAFSWVKSITSWFNMPITGEVVAVGELKYTDGDDSAEVDIGLEVPLSESPGDKDALVVFKGVLAE